jgi:hypothetical protein
MNVIAKTYFCLKMPLRLRKMDFSDIYGDKADMNPLMPPNPTAVKEIDKMMADLNKAVDSPVQSSEEDSGQQKMLYLDLPAGVWQNFIEYCKQNELDPSQMVREAVASYYLDLLRTLKSRLLIDGEEEKNLL